VETTTKTKWHGNYSNNIPNVVIVQCILHNECEIHRDTFNGLWLEDEQLDQPMASATTARASFAAEKIRNTFTVSSIILQFIRINVYCMHACKCTNTHIHTDNCSIYSLLSVPGSLQIFYTIRFEV